MAEWEGSQRIKMLVITKAASVNHENEEKSTPRPTTLVRHSEKDKRVRDGLALPFPRHHMLL